MKGAVLILGARSDIARACSHRFARAGHPLVLAARNAETLEADATDLRLRHQVAVTCVAFDATDIKGHAAFIDALNELPAIALCAVGTMGDQAESQRDPEAASVVIRTCFEGPALFLGELAQRFEARGAGAIIGISSVAGERGRASNYVYGAAKAGFTAYLSGLRNRLSGTAVQVITILPGFVATRMTEGMDLPARLVAQPDEVADAIFRAYEKKRDIIYIRPIWRLIMGVIRALPERIFKRTRL